MTANPAPDTASHIEPLDPASDEGKRVAAELSVVFADVRQAIAEREATAALRANSEGVVPEDD